MIIAVTDTGKPEKQQIYLNWLRSFAPEARFDTVSYRNGEPTLQGYDGLVLTGGEDVDPQFSKASPVELVEEVDRARDEFEFQLLEQSQQRRLPVLGICRGLQAANVFFGGTLIADLPSAGFSHHTAAKNLPELRHRIRVSGGTILGTIAGETTGEVNSYHHQSVLTPADCLAVSSLSEDGVIESLEWKDPAGKPYLMLVQWHPERMKDADNPMTTKVGRSFFDAVRLIHRNDVLIAQ